MGHRAMLIKRLVDLVDEHLGLVIEELAERYYSSDVDVDDEHEYEHLLKFIAMELLGDASESSEIELRKIIRELEADSSITKLVISYLISRYIERKSNRLEISLE